MTEEIPSDWPGISDFFAGKSVFVTGGTGFIGKALIEKLLRSCPDIREIFMLTRPKKNKSTEQRLQELFKLEILDEVKKRNPAVINKVIAIKGDVGDEELGISLSDREMLSERVSVVIHIAALVKFNISLNAAVLTNVRGTRDICILCKSMKNLVAFVHVSTMYTQTDKPVIEEVYYDPGIDWRKLITLAETVDNNVLNAITLKFIKPMPNAYTFTKRVAEKIVHDYSKEIPCILFRPSIVVTAQKEPLPGWVDGWNGPSGLSVGMGKGVLRVMYVDPDGSLNPIPVDAVVKALLIAAWKRGMLTITRDPSLHVYNSATNTTHLIKYENLYKLCLTWNTKYPITNAIWYPGVTMTHFYAYYFIMMLILHILPSLAIDAILRFNGHRPILLRMQRTILTSNVALYYFICNNWTFKNQKFMGLQQLIPEAEKEEYTCEIKELGTSFKDYTLGIKRFLLHEDIINMEAPRTYMTRLYWLHIVKNILMVGMYVWYLKRFETFPYITAIVLGLWLYPFLTH